MIRREDINKELKLRIAELERENARLRKKACSQQINSVDALVKGVTQGVAVFSNGYCKLADLEFRNIFELSEEEVRRLDFSGFIAGVDKAGELRKAMREGEMPVMTDCLVSDGQIHNVVIRIKYSCPGDESRIWVTVCNITGIVRRAEQLKFEHNELETIFNTSLIGIVYLDMNRCVRRINKRGAEIIGIDFPEKAIGRAMRSFYQVEADYEVFTGYYRDILQHGKVLDAEYQFSKKDGSTIWLRLSGKTIRNPENPEEYSGTIWIFDDISERKQVRQELESAHLELEAYFENNLVGMMVVTTDIAGNRIISRTNSKMVELSGFSFKEELIGLNVDMFCYPNERYEGFLSSVVDDLTKFGIGYFERDLMKKDGSVIWVSGYAQNLELTTPVGIIRNTVVIIDDTTEKKADREKLERANAELETYFNNSMVGIMISDEKHSICRTNSRFVDILGHADTEEIVGESLTDIFQCQGDINFNSVKFEAYLTEHRTFTRELQIMKEDGQNIWLCVTGQSIDKAVPADLTKGVVWIVEDISARKVAEEKLIKLATIDELTHLNNRRSFMDLGEKECRRSHREGYKVALFMLDIDYFKAVNDTYGHAVGDRTLKCFAEISTNMFRPSDIIGRIGGEEFVVLLPDISVVAAEKAAERFRMEINKHFVASEQGLPEITVSIGVAFLKNDESLDSVLLRADEALYAAKNQGRNKVVVIA